MFEIMFSGVIILSQAFGCLNGVQTFITIPWPCSIYGGLYTNDGSITYCVFFFVGTFINRLVEKCDVTFLSPR